jgi:cation/acetate symporter
LFWKKTTAKGVIASISVGLVSALTLILLSQKTFNEVYNLPNVVAPMQINNPAIFSVPLSFLVLIIVSLFTQSKTTGTKEITSETDPKAKEKPTGETESCGL